MQYLSFECYLFHRIGYGQIKQIKIDFHHKVQLILGSNGSGKSSLINELTPLPSNVNNYGKGGYKKLVFIHKGIKYQASSSFDTRNRHSLIRLSNDDIPEEELNKGGTASVQKELCKQLFGITQELHDLLTSSQQFTSFSPTKRREWLTSMSNINYSFAFSVYQKFKDKLRDIQGAIKFTQSRIIQETENQIKDEDIQRITKNNEELKKIISGLIDNKTNVNFNPKIEDELKEIQENQHAVLKYIREYLQLFSSMYVDKSNLDNKSIIATLTERMNTYYEHKSKLSDFIQQIDNQINKYQEIDEDEINNNISALEKQKNVIQCKFLDNLSYTFSSTYPLNELSYFESIFNALCDILHHTPSFTNNTTLKEEYEKIQTNLKEFNIQKDKNQKLINLAEGFLKNQSQLEKEDKINCPSCNHAFIPGFLPDKIDNVKRNLDKFNIEYNNILSIIEKEEQKQQLVEERIRSIRLINNLKIKTEFSELLIRNLLEQPLFFDNPSGLISVLDEIYSSLRQIENNNKINNNIALLEEQRIKNRNEDKEKKQQFLNKRNELERDFHISITQIESIKEKIRYHVIFNKKIDLLKDAVEKAVILNNEFEHKKNTLIENYRQQVINDIIHYLQYEISQNEHKLAQAYKQEAIIKSLTADLEKLTLEQHDLKIIVESLSPTEGLIAKNIQGFINSFVTQMNWFIKNTWSYPLQILPCGFSEENKELDLDYKFPLKVQGKTPEADISMGSKSMQEVINLAFKIIAMNYFKITDTPLYLDEFGHSFDFEHRRLAYIMINNLLANSSLPQIFVISHFDDCYGSLKNSDIIVLDQINIKLPLNTVFNQYVYIQ